MTDLAHKLHSAYERLHRASTDDLAERTRRINTAKVTQHAAVNDRHASITAKYGMEFQSAVQETEKAFALIESEYKEKLATADAAYHDARRARMAIWQDESLELEEKLLRLKALLN